MAKGDAEATDGPSPRPSPTEGRGREEPSPRPSPTEGRGSDAPPIDQTDRNDVMATIREAFALGGPRDREQGIRDIAKALRHERVGSHIREVLSTDIRTAVRRGILDNTGGQFTLLSRSIDDYMRDHLVDMLLAAMGPTWQTRDEAITAAARHLGFRRTGQRIQTAFKSAINAAIRRGLLERDGPNMVRRSHK